MIPKTLAINAAKDATDLVSQLRSIHHLAQSDPSKENLKWCVVGDDVCVGREPYSSLGCLRIGLDLVKGSPRDNKKAGVLEPAISKTKSIKFATEAAISILRIDDMIKLNVRLWEIERMKEEGGGVGKEKEKVEA